MGAGMLNIKNAPPFEDGVTAKQAEDSKRASPGIQGGDFIQADLGGAKNTRLVGKRLASAVQREIRWLRMNGSASTCCHECIALLVFEGWAAGMAILSLRSPSVSPPKTSAFRPMTCPPPTVTWHMREGGREREGGDVCVACSRILKSERDARQTNAGINQAASAALVCLRPRGIWGAEADAASKCFPTRFYKQTNSSLALSLNDCRLAGHCEGDPI